jgi:hypothetical protein
MKVNKYEKQYYEMDRRLRANKSISHKQAVSTIGKQVVAKADAELQEQESKIIVGYMLAMAIGGLLGFMVAVL